jgi:putative hemolysin
MIFKKTPKHTKENRDLNSEENKIHAALEAFGETTAKEVMTPRLDIIGIEIPISMEKILQAIRRSGHSRFPVYDDDLDRLVGILFVKDLLREERWWKALTGIRLNTENAEGDRQNDEKSNGNHAFEALDFSRMLRPPYLVPETRHVLGLLAEMRQKRRDFAVVVDEYGSVSGILTIKDIVGQLVGDLPDEFDTPSQALILRVDKNRWLIDGTAPIDSVNSELGCEIKDGEYVTMAGFVLDTLGEIPKVGDSVNIDNWEFRVVEMDKRRVSKVVAKFVGVPDEQ